MMPPTLTPRLRIRLLACDPATLSYFSNPLPDIGVAMKTILTWAVMASCGVAALLPMAAPASAQEWRRPHYDNPPPPPRRHHHHDNGAAIAGGLAAGVIGGLIGGAIVNNSGPRYIDPPPPPPPRCWFEDRRVPNAYDGGWHMESMRVCQ